MKKILFTFIALFFITPALWAQSGSNSWGIFVPYDSTQTVEITVNNFSNLDVRSLGLDEPGRFLSIDPHASRYPSFSPYVYVANNPLRFIDPDGRDIRVAQNEDGTYTIVGGILNDDTGIYLDNDGEKGAFIGNSITTHSFYGDDGNPVLGAVIDLNSTEGQDFLDNLVAENPGLIEYMTNAGNNGIYDFKAQGSDDRGNLTRDQHHYRGSVAADGSVGSARDFGNIGAGIVAGRQGLSWGVSRIGFDGYQMATNLRSPSVEGPTTQKAQRVGHNIGVGLRPQRPQPTIVPRLVP